MNAWGIKISANKQSILIDFQGSINSYTGVPLTVKNDAVCFARAGFNVILWINNASEIPKIDNWIREESRLPKSYKFEFDCSRPKNWVLWLKQLFQVTIHFKQSTFFYCDLFPGVRINTSTLRIVRVHDPFSNSVSATKSFIESPARMKLRVAKFLRVTAFNKIKHDSYLVFNSKFTKKRFCAIYGDSKGSIVIYPTIQFKFSPNSSFNIENQNSPYWIMIGGQRQRKKPSDIINLWAISSISSISDFVVVGEVPLTLLCVEAIEKYKAGALRFVKNIPKDELLSYISNSAASIFYSLGEGFGLPIAESLACGKTVICNDLDVFTEVTNGLSLTFQTGNPVGVLQIMESVLVRGPESLEEANALKKQASNYSIESVSARWASFLKDLTP